MTQPYIIASDIGSGGCKTIILSAQGEVIAEAQQEYPTAYPRPGWAEQNPDDWYAAFCRTVRAVLNASCVAPQDIAGVGIVGVTHNVVLLDGRDRPLCPTILMFDTRSTAQVQRILARWGTQVWERTLNDVTTAWTWPQLLWIRENCPEVWRATRRLLFPKDYVRHRLAPAFVTDMIDAGGTLLFDPVRAEWIQPFCDDLAIEPDWLPHVVPPTEIVAQVGPQGAIDTGLALGTPVIAGTTDTVAEMLGVGANSPGIATVKLASVGRIAAVTCAPARAHHILNYRHVFDGLWYPGTASKYAASAYRWLRDVIWRDAFTDSIYRVMDEAAACAPMGCDGLLFHPHLLGEWAPYWDEQLRGNFVGLTARHSRAHLTRAVLEGVAFALKDALLEMESLGIRTHDVRLIGQGARSKLWARIVCDVLNRPLHISAQTDAVFGGALITAMGLGLIADTPADLIPLIVMRYSLEPEPSAADIYARLFEIYREADTALRSVAVRLHAFEHLRVQQKEEGP